MALVAAMAAAASPAALLEPVRETSSSTELADLLERLEAAGVPYVVKAGTAMALLEHPGQTELRSPDDWRAQVLVVGNFAAAAAGILEAMRRGDKEGDAVSAEPRELIEP